MKPLAVTVAFLLFTGAASADCASAREAWDAQAPVTPVSELIRRARGLQDLGCDAEVVRTALQTTSSLAARRASSLLQSGDTEKAAALLDSAPLMHWEVLAMRGALASRRGAYDEAARAYNLALDTLGAADVTAQNPGLEPAVPRLVALAQEAMLVSGSTRATIRVDGSVSGVMRALELGLRGGSDGGAYNVVASASGAIDRILLPLRFEPGTDRLTRESEEEARALAGYLRGLPSGISLRIVGHTDAEGSSLENRILSLERAEAVRDYLEGRGVGAVIRVDGRGGEDPPRILEQGIYTPEQQLLIARRIEVIFENE